MKPLRRFLMMTAFAFCFDLRHIYGESSENGHENDGPLPNGRKILVFGGNGFIGSEAVSRLLKRGDKLTIVNRGNWYFDSEERIKPFVYAHFKCNRDKLLEVECSELMESGYYDAVIDFSSYNPRQIKQVVEILRNRVGLYIYISTDSIYEVCDKKHDGPTTEEDAIRPMSPKKRLQLKREEKYAHDKLACEEVLQEQRKEGGFPYVALRFPDVIGKRDNSFRFWTYHLWIKIHKFIHHPVHMPTGVSASKFSLIHVEDAAKAIEKVLDVGPAVHNQALNLAFNEHFTLKKLLQDISNQLKIDNLEYISEDEATWYSYPTVSRGPLDIGKAKILLDWEPMSWQEALEDLCTFFEGAITDMNMLKEREMLLAEFFEDIVPEEYYATALKKLLDFYGDEVLEGIDLGFGFDETPGIAGPTGDSRSSSFAHDQKTEENKTVAHIAEDNQETGSHTYSEKMEERLDEL